MQRHFSGRAKTASAGLVVSGHRISHGRVTGDSGRGNRPQSPDTVLRARLLRPALKRSYSEVADATGDGKVDSSRNAEMAGCHGQVKLVCLQGMKILAMSYDL